MTDHHAAGFRIRPRVWIGVVIWLAYGLLVYSVQLASGIPYTTWDENGANLFLGGGISLVVATPLLAITTTKLGWWRPALFDAERSRHRWPITAPIFMAGLLLLNLVATDWAAYDGPFLAASIVLLLVGFTEEMTLRGLLLVALRSKFAEVWVWLISTLAFALMHFGIVILGQGIAETTAQVVFAFIAGTVFYIVRRTTGTLVWAMLLHGFWDFSAFAVNHGNAAPAAELVQESLLGLGLFALIAVWFTFKSVPPKRTLDL